LLLTKTRASHMPIFERYLQSQASFSLLRPNLDQQAPQIFILHQDFNTVAKSQYVLQSSSSICCHDSNHSLGSLSQEIQHSPRYILDSRRPNSRFPPFLSHFRDTNLLALHPTNHPYSILLQRVYNLPHQHLARLYLLLTDYGRPTSSHNTTLTDSRWNSFSAYPCNEGDVQSGV
jgi:hypothetical protein